jgi:non-canonical poly(A) RNA polymerase PAPD5/7
MTSPRPTRLTAEIKAFTRYITPTDQEHDLRSAVVESIRRLITRRWRNAELHPFGSFMTRLYLPTGCVGGSCASSS